VGGCDGLPGSPPFVGEGAQRLSKPPIQSCRWSSRSRSDRARPVASVVEQVAQRPCETRGFGGRAGRAATVSRPRNHRQGPEFRTVGGGDRRQRRETYGRRLRRAPRRTARALRWSSRSRSTPSPHLADPEPTHRDWARTARRTAGSLRFVTIRRRGSRAGVAPVVEQVAQRPCRDPGTIGRASGDGPWVVVATTAATGRYGGRSRRATSATPRRSSRAQRAPAGWSTAQSGR
jgi:hypothetical protein